MPLTTRPFERPPDAWQVHGHSYFMHGFGVRNVTGRADSMLRAALDIEHGNWQNWATTGGRLTAENFALHNIARVYNAIRPADPTQAGRPDVNYGGAKLFCFGINDYGFRFTSTAIRKSFIHALRAVIDWSRASIYYDTNAAAIAYTGTAMTNIIVGGDRNYTATRVQMKRGGTTGAVITFTIPPGFLGGSVAFKFMINSGTVGGTVNFSGTSTPSTKVLNGVAGATSLVLADWGFADGLSHMSAIARFTGFTAANAGQTLVCTITSTTTDVVDFDGITLEAMNPGPIVVCNIAKLTPTGYDTYGGTVASTADATNDANVDLWNGDIYATVAEFDSMVQIADIDAKLNSTSGGRAETMSSDGLHPNEFGSGLIADACLDAVHRLYPASRFGKTAQINTPSNRWGAELLPRRSGQWYTADTGAEVAGTAYTAAAGDIFAIPFMEIQPVSRWVQWCYELTAGTATGTMGFGIYDDRAGSGYPQSLFMDLVGGPLTANQNIGTGAGVKVSTTTSGQPGYISQPVDPGLYWLVIKIVTIGTATAFRTIKGPSPFMPNLSLSGAAVAGGYSGWRLTAQGAGKLPQAFPTGALAAVDCPMLGLKYG